MEAVKENQLNKLVAVISVAVPVVVAVLLALPNKYSIGEWTKNLPHVIGAVNSITCITLVCGLYFIKRNRVDAHRVMMLASLALGAIFLVCYVIYHLTNESRRFSGEGPLRVFYLAVLISHIGLSLAVLPLVLRAAGFAFIGQFERHKSIVRFAFPIWLYVSATGVLVYVLGYHFVP